MLRAVFPDIIENDNLKRRLAADICDGSLSHAYIIEGEQGCGKHTLALEIAAALACKSKDKENTSLPLPCKSCPSCRKILSRKSPDIIFVQKESDKSHIGVDSIRCVREDVSLVPNDLEYKIYIIEDAHLMNHQAQNAFLLTLEEPPSFAIFLLLCENSQALLETIKSRAPILRIRTLSDETVSQYITEKKPEAKILKETDKEAFDALILSAKGSIGKALRLLSETDREQILFDREIANSFLEIASGRKNGKRTVKLIESICKIPREQLMRQLQYIEDAVRDLLILKKSDKVKLSFFTDTEYAYDLSSKFASLPLANMYKAIRDTKEHICANGNTRLSLFVLAIKCNLI